MPKKAPRNSFYYYMLDFKKEQAKKGINYNSLKDVADAAGPLWSEESQEVKAKFEAIVKKEKQRFNIPENKFTSTGVSLAEIEQQQRELKEAEEAERQDIKNIVVLKSFNQRILEEDFYLMDVNAYCKTGPEYLIGEFTILQFNLRDGIKNSYHEMVNPGKIPVGYAFDVKLGSQEFGLEMPDEAAKRSNYMQILANIIDYLKKKDRNVKSLPPIFTMPEKVEPVNSFILQMCSRAAEDDSLFRVYKLDLLFFTLINNIKTRSNEGFPKESLATAQLKKDVFKYTPGLACEHHETVDKGNECTMSRTKRWAYTILDSCCPVVGINVESGKHIPYDFDLNSILTFKEEKKTRAGPSIAASMVSSASCNSSFASDSLNDCASTSASTVTSYVDGQVKKERRKHTPLRMPKTDYSHRIQPAPELTEDNFPTLTAGHGRGRGLASSFNRMNIQK